MAISVEKVEGQIIVRDEETGGRIVLDTTGAKRLASALLARIPFQYEAIECTFCDVGAFKASTPAGGKWCCNGCGREMQTRGQG